MEKFDKEKMLSQLAEARQLVINNINETNVPVEWDGNTYDISAKQQYENIKLWCVNRVKNKAWSHNKSCINSVTSYGLKHECERDLKCYVANNWMKMALIDSGFEVANIKDIEFNSGRLYRTSIFINDILTNHINFIYRLPKDFKPFDSSIMTDRWINNTDKKIEYRMD